MAITIPITTTFNDKGISKAAREIKKAEGGWNKFGAGIKAAAKPAAIGLAALAVAGVAAAKAGEEAATAQAALDQVFSQMGYSENAQAASDYARELEALTGIDDKVIKGAQTKLATFDAVAKDTALMARTTQLSADLMAAGYGDMETQAQGLGKALQDPAKGMELLTRQGALTKDQQAQIASAFEKTGDKAAAQRSILEALEKQVGGVAEATANDSDKIAVSVGNVAESFGAALLPALAALTPYLTGFADWMSNNTGTIVAIATVLGTLAAAVLVVNGAMAVWSAIGSVVTGVNLVLGTSFTLALGPVLLVIAAIAALIAIGILVWKNWDKISAGLKVVWNAIKKAAAAVFGAIKKIIVTYFKAYKAVVVAVWNAIKKVITAVLKGIKAAVTTYVNAYKKIFTTVFNAIKTVVTTVVNKIRSVISTGMNKAKSAINTAMSLIKAIFRGDFGQVLTIVTGLTDSLIRLMGGIPNRIVSALGNLGSLLYNKGRELVQGFINGIKSLLGTLGGVAGNILSAINPFSASTAAAPSARSFAAPGARTTSTRSTTTNLTMNINARDPYVAARVMQRASEGYAMTQGRARGTPLAVAW